MEETIEHIDRLAQTLAELQPLPPEYQQRLDKKIRLEFNYNSNHIEGNILTYGETKLLLIFDKTTGNHELREYEEMKAHDVAFELINYWAKDKERPLSEMAVRNLHEKLLVRPFWKEALTADGQPTRRLIKIGDYKEQPNSVRLQSGEMFHYASPQETPMLMGELVQWYKDEEEKKTLHPVALAALLHYRFVCIHPFDDGNGRISRLLMNYVLLRHHFPPVVIQSADKRNYLFALNQADTGNIDAFVTYIAEQLIWSIELSVKAAKGEEVEEQGDWEKSLKLLKNKLAGGAKEVELKHSPETLSIVMKNSLVPLVEAWEEKLKKIDPLFLNRFNIGTINDKITAKGNSMNETLQEGINEEGKIKIEPNQSLKVIKLLCSFQGLRSYDNNISFNGGEIIIEFFPNAYEITCTGVYEALNKLYSQPITQYETGKLLDGVMKWVTKNLEEYLATK